MIEQRRLSCIFAPILAAVAGALFLMGLLSGLALASPGDLFVSPGGSGDCSQSDPCDLLMALTLASDGDTVYVAQGAYTGTGAAVITVTNSITLYGGWDGATTAPPVRDPETNPTTLDGEGQRRVVYISGGITPTLEGFWLTNGSTGSRGGGVYVGGAHAIISGCRILSNTGKDGGGVFFGGSANAVLVGNEIYSNTAQQYGGGVASDTSLSITLTGNRFYSNTAPEDGGAISLWYGANAKLSDNEIYGNTANRDGGGIYIREGSTTLIDNVIGHNTAWQYGGGLLLGGGEATFERNSIQGNIAGSEAGMGLVQSTATLVNNIVADNVKMGFPCASGIGIEDSTVTLMHNTIARNRGFSPGSGIYVMEPSLHASVVTLVNNILVSHTVGITVAAGNTATLEATLWGDGVWANETTWGGGGDVSTGTINVWEAPGFVDHDGGDYHIAPSSAAVDRGVDAGVETDMDGDHRPIGAQPDIGADEVWRRIFLPLTLRNYS
jgi:hypothetical protein